jgi:hypothetical protein
MQAVVISSKEYVKRSQGARSVIARGLRDFLSNQVNQASYDVQKDNPDDVIPAKEKCIILDLYYGADLTCIIFFTIREVKMILRGGSSLILLRKCQDCARQLLIYVKIIRRR